jgi:hypothetical protein
LTEAFAVAKGHDLHGYWDINLRFRKHSPEYRTHLLKAHSHFAATLFSRVSHYRKMRRLYFHPLWVGHGIRGTQNKGDNQDGKAA